MKTMEAQMRATLPMAAVMSLFAASSALAATITQTLPAIETLGDFTPFDINGARFDPSLGTLTSVTGELTGTVTTSAFLPVGPFPTTRLTTNWFVFTPSGIIPGPNAFSGSLPDQTVTPVVTSGGATYTGSPTPVDLTFNFGNPAEFVGSPSPSTLLVEFGFRAGTPDLTNHSGASDLTTFNGNLLLTYTYNATAIPEPGSLLTLGVGVLALIGYGCAKGRNAAL
jgi:hypothetical protein